MPYNNLFVKSLKNAINVQRVMHRFIVGKSGGFNTSFDVQALMDIDSRLPHVLDFVCRNFQGNELKTLRRTFAHWDKPMPPAGEGFALMWPVKIKEDDCSNGETISFKVTASRHKIITLAGGLEIVGTGITAAEYIVSATWLKQYYPEVHTKFSVLKAMGLKPKEISKLSLEQGLSSQTPVDIAGVSFD